MNKSEHEIHKEIMIEAYGYAFNAWDELTDLHDMDVIEEESDGASVLETARDIAWELAEHFHYKAYGRHISE